MAYRRLGDILKADGLVTEEQIAEVIEKGGTKRKRLGQALVDAGYIDERQMIDALCRQLGMDFVDVSEIDIPVEMASIVPKGIAAKYMVVPIKRQGDVLYLAMEDPLNFLALEEVRAVSHLRVNPVIGTHTAVERAIGALYGNEGVFRAIDDLKSTLPSATESVSNVGLSNDAEVAPTVRLIDSVIERAVIDGASDVHLEPREGGMAIRLRIDGVLHQILVVPKGLQESVISRIKVMGNMDIAEHRVPQDGRSATFVSGKDVDMRISTLPTRYGEKVVIRLLIKSEELLTEKGIGLTGEHLRQYNDLIHNANGVILISGPTGSGKSTTMSTMVSSLNGEAVNVTTLEDPVEYDIDGVNQVQVNEKTGMSFASGLRSILRQDPDIVAVGEIRDGETAEIAMRAAITGHLVLSTIHTNSAPATIDRLEDIGVERYLIATALKGVIAQRLVRVICPKCKEEYEATDEELEALGIQLGPHEKRPVLYRGEGCLECHSTGYHGRTAAYEILMMNAHIKEVLNSGGTRADIQRAVRESGFVPMVEHCRELVLSGVTTVSEAVRILHTTDG